MRRAVWLVRPDGRRLHRKSSGNADMDTFNEMLAEYLKGAPSSLSIPPDSGSAVSDEAESAANPQRTLGSKTESDDEDSYVYDVYYRARTPMSSEETAETYGTLSGLKMSDLVGDLSGESDSDRAITDDEDSNGTKSHTRIGTSLTI